MRGNVPERLFRRGNICTVPETWKGMTRPGAAQECQNVCYDAWGGGLV
jgi:hypothetical protein